MPKSDVTMDIRNRKKLGNFVKEAQKNVCNFLLVPETTLAKFITEKWQNKKC